MTATKGCTRVPRRESPSAAPESVQAGRAVASVAARPVTASWAWQSSAACRGRPLELFFGHDGERQRDRERREKQAAAVCAGCPVRAECFGYAISRPERYGTWGGTAEDDRETERRKRVRAAAARARRERAAS